MDSDSGSGNLLIRLGVRAWLSSAALRFLAWMSSLSSLSSLSCLSSLSSLSSYVRSDCSVIFLQNFFDLVRFMTFFLLEALHIKAN